MSTKIKTLLFILGLGVICQACKKYLDEKPDKQLAVPTTLADFQSLLDNYAIFADEPAAGEMSSDDYYVTTNDWLGIYYDSEKRTYTWEKDYLFEPQNNSWSSFSSAVYYCNSVLEGVAKIDKNNSNQISYDNVKGQALYFRAKRFLQASFIWTLAYDKATSSTDLGLPLRLNTDFNTLSVRSSVEQTYQQIITDAKMAAPLLPVKPLSPTRASKPAAYALLARTYLSMRDYTHAGLYADSSLQLYNTLLDYNDLDSTSATPLARFNKEVISENEIGESQLLGLSRSKISSDLYNLYHNGNDLRRVILFGLNSDGSHFFKGRFVEGFSLFGGMATNEMYLVRAECYARQGQINAAMNDLNTLLVKRWRKNTFVPFTASGTADALKLILAERRKELLFRGIRWMDIKRLNKEGAGIVLTRNVNNQTYTLFPNDLRYALPIPEDVITLSGMPQNPH